MKNHVWLYLLCVGPYSQPKVVFFNSRGRCDARQLIGQIHESIPFSVSALKALSLLLLIIIGRINDQHVPFVILWLISFYELKWGL